MAYPLLNIPSRNPIIGLLLLSFLFPSILPAQSIYEQIGRLPITTYSAEEYGGQPTVLAAIQSDDGLMYFGTTSGIHEYDGVSWRSLFKSNEAITIGSFTKYAADQIFYAGSDFGYLEADQKGETRAVSLLHLIPEELQSNFLAYEIHYLNGYILLRTRDHHLIRLELNEDFTLKSLKFWQAETRFGTSFLVGNDFYVRQAERGVSKLQGEEIKLIPDTEKFGTVFLSAMLPYPSENDKSLLLGGGNTGFYRLEGGIITKFPTEVDELINKGNQLYRAIPHQGNYILSFFGAGVVMMNPKGEILRRIGAEQGLPSDVVSNVYLDQNDGLWVSTEDGMARIGINSPIQTFGNDLGINSTVQSIQKQGEEVFLGTNTGLLKFESTAKEFKSVPQIDIYALDLRADGDDMIVTNNGRLDVIRNGKAINLYEVKDGIRVLSLLIPKNHPNHLLVGASNGLMVYQRGLSKEFPWEYMGNVPDIESVSNYLFESMDGTIFTTTGETLYALNLGGIGLKSGDPNRIKVNIFKGEVSDTFSLVDGEFYITSPQGMQKYLPKEGKFVPTMDFSAVEKDMIDFNQHKSGVIWYESFDKKKYILKRDSDGKFVKGERPNSIAPYLSNVDFIDADSIMWFGSPKGLIRYDPKKDNQTDMQFFTLIRRIETKTDTLPLVGYGRIKDLTAPETKDNSYRFEFAAPYFEEEKKTKYQTYLEGFEADWVEWNDNRFKEYTNLSPGSYTFHVRALAHTGRISEEAVFSFVVLPPWYATWWAYLIYVLLFCGLITAIVKWRSQQLQAENRILEERVNERTSELEKSLIELKSTQAQLIQSEKMASLGELTAGIAHEIQNPLNFVNNFSEVSEELIEEIKESRAKNQEARQWTEADKMEEEILDDIKKNLEKIHHHGKRAGAIVKGMLDHSRTSTGEKVPTDINALADEYLRLSYHGLRAKDKSFNADFKTDFDPNLPKMIVVPQDIGRVLLNLINNAFQACSGQPSKGLEPLEGYMPIVNVSTKNLGDKIEISVQDNGPGIPDAIKDKIFQPFFTTKPTGQGTGLGLSLSYDIVKAHSGAIKLENLNGNGCKFVIELPNANNN